MFLKMSKITPEIGMSMSHVLCAPKRARGALWEMRAVSGRLSHFTRTRKCRLAR